MDKSEPSLVPEWLRTSGNGTGSGGASHHFASSQSDGPQCKRNKSFKSIGSSDGFHSFKDRTSSLNVGRTLSSNGLTKHEKNQYSRYSSFTRGQRERDRGRSTIDNHWDADYSDPLRSITTGRIEKDVLRRPQPVASRRQSDVLQRRPHTDLNRSGQSNPASGNGQLSVGGMDKVAFEKDFPSLVSEERPITPDIGRVPSPGLTRSMQSLSIGNSALIGGDGWTSALAEVPAGVAGNNTTSTPYQPAISSSASATSGAPTGLNMAETLLLAPSKSQSAQQSSVQNNKREELTVLQSMKLIPMPSIPKNTTLNHSDKLKPKTGPRSGDQVAASKNGHQLMSSQLGTQPVRGANVKIDGPKTAHTGKLLVLKPARENGVSLALKDSSSPKGSLTDKVVNGQGVVAQTGAIVASPRKSTSATISAFASRPGSMVDKKPSLAQAQSRSDFFNLMRKKSMSNTPAHVESSPAVSSAREKSVELENGASPPASPAKSDVEANCNGDACSVSQRPDETSNKEDLRNCHTIFPDEEEAAFLRSLGWEESAESGDDEEGLTEEEINAFYQEYMKLKPASKLCRDLQMKMLGQTESPAEFGTSNSSA